MAGEDATEVADAAIEALIANEEDAVRELIHSDLQSYFNSDDIQRVFEQVPDQQPQSLTLAAVSVQTSDIALLGGSQTITNMTYVATYDADTVGIGRASITIRTQQGSDDRDWLIFLNFTDTTINVNAEPTIMTPVVTGLAIGLAAFTAISLLAAIFTPRLKRRILWSVFIALVGSPVFSFVIPGETWQFVGPGVITNGSMVKLQLFEIRLFSASYLVNAISGFTQIELAVPVGAILFWAQRLRGKLSRKPQESSDPVSDEPTQDTLQDDA